MTAAESFITAEETFSLRPSGWVLLTAFAVKIDEHLLVTRFEITTHSGYRAIVPACICDRTPCLKDCGAHGHCHWGKHIEHARKIAADVAKTYGSAKKQRVGRG